MGVFIHLGDVCLLALLPLLRETKILSGHVAKGVKVPCENRPPAPWHGREKGVKHVGLCIALK